MISRRGFLVRAALAGAIALALPGCLFSDPDADLKKILPLLDAAALDVKAFDPALLPRPADEAALRKRLAQSLRGHFDETKPLGEAIAKAIAEDYAKERVVEVDGWLLSRTEADLLAVAALLHARNGTTAATPTVTAKTAQVGQIAAVEAWGPASTCAGQGFNVQSDGHSSLWINVGADAPIGLLVLLDGIEVASTQANGLLTTRIEGEVFDQLFGQPGEVRVELFDANAGLKQEIGKFVVDAGGEFATTTTGKRSTVFRAVDNWGPRSTRVLTPFNTQGTEDSAFWISTACAPGGVRVRLGDTDLSVSVSAKLLSANLRGLGALQRSGALPLTLYDPVSKESVLVGEFVIAD